MTENNELRVQLDEAYRLYGQGAWEQAGEHLESIVGVAPDCGEAWYALGTLALQIGDPESAVNLLAHASNCGFTTPACLTNLGEARRRAGDIDGALTALEQACSIGPGFRDAWLNWGSALAARARYGEAREKFDQALQIDPACVPAQLYQGDALRAEGLLPEAAGNYRQVIASDASCKMAWLGLGECLRLQGDFLGAMDAFEKVGPDSVEALTGLAAVALEQRNFDSAAAVYKSALALRPDHWEALFGLGIVGVRRENYLEAESALRRAVEMSPGRKEGWLHLGDTLAALDRYSEATEVYRHALTLDPEYWSCQVGIGNVHLHQGRLDEAVGLYRMVDSKAPRNFRIQANLALALQEMGRFRDAEKFSSCALQLAGDEEDVELAQSNRAQLCLRMGRIAEGWTHYEARKGRRRGDRFAYPAWRGESLAGKHIFVWQDQGIGDQILFSSMFAELIGLAGAVTIECRPKLLPLLRRSFPAATVVPLLAEPHRLAGKAFDFHCAAGSLGQWLRPDISSFPRQRRWLQVDQERRRHWQRHFSSLGPRLLVGICWRSMMQQGRRDLHYSRLEEWGAIFSMPGICLVNLQYDRCDDELEEARRKFGVEIINFPQVDMFDDLDETAAMISGLDVVVSAPTSVVRMAGALGVRSFLLTLQSDWTCMGSRRDPWMPSITPYRKKWDQSWGEVLTRVSADLQKLAERKAGARPAAPPADQTGASVSR